MEQTIPTIPKPYLIPSKQQNARRADILKNATPSHSLEKTDGAVSTSKGQRSQSDAALELFQEELRSSIAQRKGQKMWKKVTCPEHGITDCYYINVKSPTTEVRHWLELKGFSERALEVLKPMTAEMLFRLQKSQLEKYLEEEGAKLHSYLLIQKNMSGYKTVTSKELNQILAERRQKADVV